MEARQRFLIYILVLFGVIGFWGISFHRVSAYGISTHALLTSSAFDFYNQRTAGQKIPETLRGFLIDGSGHEDSPPRQTNHYYDPIHNHGLRTDTYDSYSSKEWAVSDAAQNDPKWKATAAITSGLSAAYQKDLGKLNLESDFTWNRAKYFYRAGDTKKAFYVLGHILHLIQDASVPAYTRNDFVSIFDEDPYVWYARQYTLVSPDYELSSRLAGRSMVTYPALGDYFDQFATYSNTRFYSKDSIGVYAQPVSYTRRDENGVIFRLAMDPEFGVYHLVKEPEVVSSDLYKPNSGFTVDGDIISSDYWRILSTKAVQYSAGVIDLFFQEVAADANKPLGQDPETSGRSAIGKFVTFVKEIQQILNLAGTTIQNGTVDLLNETGVAITSDTDTDTSVIVELAERDTTTPIVSLSSTDVKRGDTISESGRGFTPNGFVALHFVLPGGGEATAQMEADKTGSFAKLYTMPTNAQLGNYVYYATDETTAEQSAGVEYLVTDIATITAPGGVVNTTSTTDTTKQSPVSSVATATKAKQQTSTSSTASAPIVKTCSYGQSGNPTYEPLVINEVAWMGTLAGSQNEWVELKNVRNVPLNLEGYQLIDGGGKIHVTLGKITVPAGGYVLLERTDDESVPGIAADVVYTGAIGNSNEGLHLFTNVCVFLDAVIANPAWPAGDNDTKRTMERTASLQWQTSYAPLGTPRAANSQGYVKPSSGGGGGWGGGGGAAPQTDSDTSTTTGTDSGGNDDASNGNFTYSTSTSALIGEIFPGAGTGASDVEWVKLYNPTADAVNLAGWSLRRGMSATSSEVLLQAFPTSTIPSLGFYLVGSPEYAASSTVSADAAYSGSAHLSYADDALLLVNANLEIVDAVSYASVARGNSLERYAYDGSLCHEPTGMWNFHGNGCADALFYENVAPRAQNRSSMLEPRDVPRPSGSSATFSYTPSSVTLSGSWSPYVDAMGDKNGLIYTVTDAVNGDVFYSSSSLAFSQKLLEVGRNYQLKFQAFDKDGLGSAIASSTIAAPSFLDEVYLYPDNRAGGTKYLVEAYYGAYPFIPDVYQGGANATWKGVIFSLDREPVEDNLLTTSGKFEPADTNGVLNLRYKQCSGSDTPLRAVIFPDAASLCDVMGGGLVQQGISFAQLEDKHVLIESASSTSELTLSPSDYLTASFYSFYGSGGGEQKLKLVAVDKTKHHFQMSGANKFAPVMGMASTTLDHALSKLTVYWQRAIDPDTLDGVISYDINFSPPAGFDETLWQRVSGTDAARLAYDRQVGSGDSFIIGMRAVDDFGNISESVYTSWSYPSATVHIAQDAENGWSSAWGFVTSNALTEPDEASFQNIMPTQDLSFNFMNVKVKSNGAYGNAESIRLSVYPDNGAGKPDFSAPAHETQVNGVLPVAGIQEIAFTFPGAVSLSAGETYWFVLDIAGGSGQPYFYNKWYNAIMTGGTAYVGGNAGRGLMRGNLSSCGTFCSFDGDYYDTGASDWYFSLGLQ